MRSSWVTVFTGLSVALSGCCDPPASGYRSVGTLALDPMVQGGEIDGEAIEALMATEIIVIQSWQVRERVVTRYELREPFGVTEIDAVEGLGTALDVARLEGSTVLEVSVTTPDPEVSTEVCNAMMDAYVEYRLDQRMEPLIQQEAWLSQQIRDLERDLADPVLTDPQVRTERQQLLAEVQQRFADTTLERSLWSNDARIIDRCSLPATAE